MAGAEKLEAAIEERRREVNASLESKKRARLGQFMTPAPVARALASAVDVGGPELRLLDPGAGIGSLTSAVVARVLDAPERPQSVYLTAYEIDEVMRVPLQKTLDECTEALAAVGVEAGAEIIEGDFVEDSLSGTGASTFTAAILNPPFMKMPSTSGTASRVRSRGWSAANLYTVFWCAAIDRVLPGGDIVAVTPRSFCNGSYFRGFRQFFLENTAIESIHVFDSRSKAFSDDGVLQETVITHSVRGASPGAITLSVSHSPDSVAMTREVPADQVVHPDDPGLFIRLPLGEETEVVRVWMSRMHHSMRDLGVEVSTGPVVDFRTRDHLRARPEAGTVPLLYPTHLVGGAVRWPATNSRKPNAFLREGAEKLVVRNGPYTLVKRFSAKEERRRVVASYYDGTLGAVSGEAAPALALENHLNYFHRGGQPLPDWLAKGLTVYLNSSVVDSYFREFNGHTQVNAGDLRSLRYPGLEELRILGKSWHPGKSQADVDAAVAAI